MRPTRWYTLLLTAVVAGAVVYAWTRSSYDSNPRPSTTTVVGIGILAVAVMYIAFMTRARLEGRAGTRPIDPLVVARFAALAKAASIVGALGTGGYAGFIIWVARIDSPTANTDTGVAAFGVGVSILMLGGALFLEHVCRVPKQDDDDDESAP